MPRPKIAPFYLFMLQLKEDQRKNNGVYLAPDRLHAYANSQWTQLDAMAKNQWRQLAEKKNAEARMLPPVFREPVADPVPFEMKSRYQQLLVRAKEFLNHCGRERLSLMSRDFICCSITPFFRSSDDYRGSQTYYPGEICLVRWSISQGVKEVYQVYVDPDVADDARHVSPREWHEWSSVTACRDYTTIAKEIARFVGHAGGVLVRSPQVEKVDSCLKFFFSEVGHSINTFDQTIILHQLIARETNAKQLAIADVRAKFNAQSGMSEVRMSVDGVHTGVRCSWHSNNAICPARRAVGDAFVLSQQLGEAFVANCLPGKHSPIVGRLISKVGHDCSRRIELFRFKESSEAAWEVARNTQ